MQYLSAKELQTCVAARFIALGRAGSSCPGVIHRAVTLAFTAWQPACYHVILKASEWAVLLPTTSTPSDSEHSTSPSSLSQTSCLHRAAKRMENLSLAQIYETLVGKEATNVRSCAINRARKCLLSFASSAINRATTPHKFACLLTTHSYTSPVRVSSPQPVHHEAESLRELPLSPVETNVSE
jgi:hypothetical protein